MATASSQIVAPSATLRVALVGNPNTGKSTLFNALAGLNVRTGNYAGVTIEKKIGRTKLGDQVIELVDLPGTYSLAPRSPDELVAVQVLTDDVAGEPPISVIVCVVNAGQLQRNLFLVSQLLELGKPTVLALNMIDAAQARGMSINVARLSQQLGIRVVATSAAKRQGMVELKQAIADAIADGQEDRVQRDQILPPDFYAACNDLRSALLRDACTIPESDAVAADGSNGGGSAPEMPDQYLLERMLLDRGGEAERRMIRRLGGGVLPALMGTRERLREQLGDLTDMECNSRYAWAKTTLDGVVSERSTNAANWTERLDAILTHRFFGAVIFVGLMLLIFQSIYSFAGMPMEWIEAGTGWVTDRVCDVMGPGMLRSLITDGIIAGVGGVLIFLPQIALLFFFLAILEDCGYISRAAFLVDRVMTLFGLSGKSFLPLMSSFACAVPGVMAARVIENRRDRIATIMVAPLMSCSARLPVYLLLIAAFIPATKIFGGWFSLPALVLMAMYLVGVVVAIPVGWLLKLTLLRGEVAPFVLELPEYKIPAPRVVFSRVWEASRAFVVRAGTLIFAASIVIWFAGYWPGDHSQQLLLETQLSGLEEDSAEFAAVNSQLQAESGMLLENSLLGIAGHAIEPTVRPLGWDWKIGVGVIASFPAREVIIATLGTIYSLGGDADEAGMVGALRAAKHADGTPVYTIPVALSVMVFFALCAQCVSTLLVIRRETNSWFWPILSFVYMTVLAYIGAFVTYQVGCQFL